MIVEWGNLDDFNVLKKELGSDGSFIAWQNRIWRVTEIDKETKKKKILAILNFCFYNEEVEICLWSSQPSWLSKKLVKMFFDYCFRELKSERITASTVKSNIRTRRILEGLGFIHEGTKRRANKEKNELMFGLLKKEWQRSSYGKRWKCTSI